MALRLAAHETYGACLHSHCWSQNPDGSWVARIIEDQEPDWHRQNCSATCWTQHTIQANAQKESVAPLKREGLLKMSCVHIRKGMLMSQFICKIGWCVCIMTPGFTLLVTTLHLSLGQPLHAASALTHRQMSIHPCPTAKQNNQHLWPQKCHFCSTEDVFTNLRTHSIGWLVLSIHYKLT